MGRYGTQRTCSSSFKYGEDGVDPSRSIQGNAVDVDDILCEVLGDEADLLAKIEEKRWLDMQR